MSSKGQKESKPPTFAPKPDHSGPLGQSLEKGWNRKGPAFFYGIPAGSRSRANLSAGCSILTASIPDPCNSSRREKPPAGRPGCQPAQPTCCDGYPRPSRTTWQHHARRRGRRAIRSARQISGRHGHDALHGLHAHGYGYGHAHGYGHGRGGDGCGPHGPCCRPRGP